MILTRRRTNSEAFGTLRMARTFVVTSGGGIAPANMPAKPKSEGVCEGRPACISTVFIRSIRRSLELALSRWATAVPEEDRRAIFSRFRPEAFPGFGRQRIVKLSLPGRPGSVLVEI